MGREGEGEIPGGRRLQRRLSRLERSGTFAREKQLGCDCLVTAKKCKLSVSS